MVSKLSFLIVGFLLLVGCSKSVVPSNQAVMDDLWQSMARYNGTIESRGVNMDSLYDAFAPQVSNAQTDEELYETLTQMLLHFRDPHIWLFSPFGKFFTLQNLGYSRNINFDLVRNQYLTKVEVLQDNIVSGLLEGDIAYLYIRDFKSDVEATKIIFEKYIDSIADQKGLVIDLRENDGGNVYNAQNLLNKLTDQKLLWHTTENRTLEGFDAPFEWYMEPNGDFQFTKKVVVLIGRFTVSAGERFAIGATQIPHLLLMGDTTANTQGSVMGRELLNGWSYTFTFERCLDPNGINYDGKGIPPDVKISQEGNSRDVVLERAIEEF